MFNVEAIKQSCGSDIETLVHTVTGIDRNTQNYQKCLDSAWSLLFSKYRTRPDDQEGKQTLLSFSDKFVFHGYPQKAKNLKTLVHAYENSEYFKNSDPNVKWGIVHLLISLSYKPTYALEDDSPVDLAKLAIDEDDQVEEEEEINWPEYLKEGLVKYELPTDDESSLSDTDSGSSGSPEPPTVHEVDEKCLRLFELEPKLVLEPKVHKVELESPKIKQKPWWKISGYREIPRMDIILKRIRPEEIFCISWEKKMLELGKNVGTLTILSEYKILRCLIWALGSPPKSNTYLLNVNDEGYSVKELMSIPSLIPLTFKEILQSFFLNYLSSIRDILNFIAKIDSIPIDSPKVPNTYKMYSYSLKTIVQKYRKHIFKIEDEVKKQETYFSLRRLFILLNQHDFHWLKMFKFLSNLHQKAVYSNFEEIRNWQCSMRLLSVLYDNLKTCVNWEKTIVLRLFIQSFSSYFDIIGWMLCGKFDNDLNNEFIICRAVNQSQEIEIKNYQEFVNGIKSDSLEFWDPFVLTCYKAISSVHFLLQLEKPSEFTKAGNDYDELFLTFCSKLKTELANYINVDEEPEEILMNDYMVTFTQEEIDFNNIKKSTFFENTIMYGDAFDPIFNRYRHPIKRIFTKTSAEKFVDSLYEAEIDTHLTQMTVLSIAVETIEKYMEPVGFAERILLSDYKLLDIFRLLQRVYFHHIIQPFVSTLFEIMNTKKQWTYNWTDYLRMIISDRYPLETGEKFSFQIGNKAIVTSLVDSNNIIELLSFVTLNYQTDHELRLILTDKILEEYNDIFRFLLQLKYAYSLILNLRFSDLKESPENYVKIRSLHSLKMWILHTMTALNNYFSYIDLNSFEDNMIKTCEKARDLHTIRAAHKGFISSYKAQCFIKDKNSRKDTVLKIFRLCHQFSTLWESQSKNSLEEDAIKKFETIYLKTMENFSTMLLSIQHPDSNYGLLFDDIMNNQAVKND